MKLLIVEDEEKINKALSTGFKEEGFEVDSVFDGNTASETIMGHEYDCIILDLMLPGIDGITLLKEIRSQKDFTPVIILTAKSEVDEKVVGLNSGADDYLAKPFSFDELLSRVKAVIRRTSINQDVLLSDNLTLNPYNKEVIRNGVNIHITGKDFALLEFLMKYKGSVISEDRIIRHVWGYDDDINSNVVATHIKTIRYKIDKAFPKEKPIIHTLRGLGYKIDG